MLHVKCTKRQNLGMDDAHAMRLFPQTKCGLAGVVDMKASHVLHTSACDALSIELWKQVQLVSWWHSIPELDVSRHAKAALPGLKLVVLETLPLKLCFPKR